MIRRAQLGHSLTTIAGFFSALAGTLGVIAVIRQDPGPHLPGSLEQERPPFRFAHRVRSCANKLSRGACLGPRLAPSGVSVIVSTHSIFLLSSMLTMVFCAGYFLSVTKGPNLASTGDAGSASGFSGDTKRIITEQISSRGYDRGGFVSRTLSPSQKPKSDSMAIVMQRSRRFFPARH